MRLIIIRNEKTVENVNKIFQSQTNGRLSKKGALVKRIMSQRRSRAKDSNTWWNRSFKFDWRTASKHSLYIFMVSDLSIYCVAVDKRWVCSHKFTQKTLIPESDLNKLQTLSPRSIESFAQNLLKLRSGNSANWNSLHHRHNSGFFFLFKRQRLCLFE